ncbi:MAG: 5-bromo-4-chloroindolyl phosphate hydrolysis family protein [Shimia sp.]
MAQRYGGKFSPDGAPDNARPAAGFKGAKPARGTARVNFLFLAPLPLIFSIFGGGATALVLGIGALGILLLSAWLTREGLKAEEAYNARTIAKRPAFPRKMFASGLMGLGLTTGAWLAMGPAALVVGIVGAALHSFSFGIDPLRDKGAEGIDQFESDRVARMVDEAEKHLEAMDRHIATTKDREAIRRTEAFQTTARQMMRRVEEDPRDLTAARKFLGVYLKGAADAARKFAGLYDRTGDGDAKTEYLKLLDDLEANYAAKTERLLLNDRTDMDIEIKVLRDRLAREGVRLDQPTEE